MIKSRYIIRLVTLTAALCLLFSIASFADSVTALGNVEIYGDNNTVSTGTGTIQMQNGTVQVGSTNDSAQIVTNTNTTNTKLDTINNSIGTTNTRLNTLNSTLTNFRTAFDSYVTAITTPIAILYDNLCNPLITTTQSRSISVGGKSYSYNLPNYNNTGYYMNFSGLFKFYVFNLYWNVTQSYVANYNEDDPTSITLTLNSVPLIVGRKLFSRYSYDSSNDVVSVNTSYYYSNLLGYFTQFFNYSLTSYFSSNIAYLADTWYRWYNPNISLANSLFWKAYNTDTDSYDNVNLSTVYMYITWYLGQMYISATEAAADIQNDVDTLGTTLSSYESQETNVFNSVKSSLNSVDDYFNLPVLSQGGLVLSWLQYMWGSLGIFQSVTFLSWALIIIVIVTAFYKIKRIQL